MTHYEDGCRCPDGGAAGARESRLPVNNRGIGVERVNLTPQEVAALLQGLSQGMPEVEAESAAAALSLPPTGLGRRERRRGLGLQKISHWWAAITELQWPQF